uniref:TBC1 domain family member 4 n=1 Tax=Cyprinus carpio TaxID=7962 RepID=A0A8C2B284_CYPCA
MEGICFEVKPRDDPIKDHPLCDLTQTLPGSEGKREKEEGEEEIQYRLTLVGSLAVHPQTTMAMLPWVVAEIRRPRLGEKNRNLEFNGAHSPEPVVLQISADSVCCILDTAGPGKLWDPLQHMVLFDHRPHRITKLIHNSQEPSYFGCLLREEKKAACYVFRCQDQMKVPQIISTLRQAATMADAATAFAKKFEVLFCGRVVVAHKKAPPALIDECIEKFGRVSVTGSLAAGIRRAFSLNQGADGGGKRPLFFKRDQSLPFLQALDENGLSTELQRRASDGATGVQPTSLQENRTMLFTIGRSQIFLVSPDTKKVAIEKSFREISFCSQGIRHVDHFGFICRESVERGGCQFVCYVFQCANEALVDEIMLTLKQAFSVAALQQNSRTQSQQCDSCPLQQLHKLCDRIEGLHPSKAKLELQKHLAGLDNQEQAAVFESTMKARPKSDQEENEFIVSCLRRLYEDRQKTHTHTHDGQTKKVHLLLMSSSSLWTPITSVCLNPGAVCVVGDDSPLRSRRHSWRQQIFLRVATPQKGSDSTGNTLVEYVNRVHQCKTSPLSTTLYIVVPLHAAVTLDAVPEERRKRSGAELRALWRKTILQQILLLRMERENQKLQASESDLQCRRLKLDYEEITPCLKDVTLVWERMLSTTGRSKVRFDTEEIHKAVGQGVPRQHRGEIWKLLSEQYLLRKEVPSTKPPNSNTPYKELLKQLTSQQHAILIDLGRTFPTHPYFSAQLGAGQLSLYNLLKAYSLLDPEVGYCQGLSFVAGVLLLHMCEEDAFHMLKFLMYDMGLRKQYRPDMIILQIQMYQLSRLLHDYHRELYTHLEQYEIGPSLYAAPWFLTAFASHFPLGFVARVFDMLFLQGSEVIFKVALSLLGSHKPLILQHDNLESIVEFIKTTLPNLGLVQMEKTINQVSEMDISKQLQAYEVEYHVLQDELLDGPSTLSHSQRVAQLEKTNGSLRQQNLDLLEELQVGAHAKIRWLETRVDGLVNREAELQSEVKTLQQERTELQQTVSKLRDLLSSLGINSSFPDQENLTNTSNNQ